uniref:Uncharacterized protein n=1 Tax=Zea mays TaxID=4577 RepID=C4J605_MAIZE|nr:unknown [Zea mays]
MAPARNTKKGHRVVCDATAVPCEARLGFVWMNMAAPWTYGYGAWHGMHRIRIPS